MSDSNSSMNPGTEPERDRQRWSGGPGARLLAERRNQGLSLGDIARQLKLSVRQVEALERDDYSSFAGPVFVRGFLRNYAKLLHIDADSLLEAAELASVAPIPQSEQIPVAGNVSVSGSDRGRRILGTMALSILAVVAIVLLASNAARDRHEQQPSAPGPSLALQTPAASPQHPESPPPDVTAGSPTGTTSAPAAEPTAQAPATAERRSLVPEITVQAQPAVSEAARGSVRPEAPQATPAVAPAQPRIFVSGSGPAQIQLAFEGESWVEVKDSSGETIYARLNGAGTERVVKGTPPFSLVVGNARGVKIRYKDKSVDLEPHTRVDVARITLE